MKQYRTILKPIIFIFLLVAILLVKSNGLQAQETEEVIKGPETLPNAAWYCPAGDCRRGDDSECKPSRGYNPATGRVEDYERYIFDLHGANLPADTPIYIVSGYDSEDHGTLWTTYSKTLDEQFFGSSSLGLMKQDQDYKIEYIEGTTNPFYADEDGTAHVVVYPATDDNRPHSFLFMWLPTADVVDEDKEGLKHEASDITFGIDYATFSTNSQPAECKSYRADPYGRVFNENLRPVPGSIVTINDAQTSTPVSLPGLPNPVTTKEDGAFNFNVEPGTYALITNLGNNPDYHKNASLAYSDFYLYGQSITETLDKKEHRDIPVLGGNTPILKLMSYGYLPIGPKSRIQGIASWPLTIAEVMQEGVSLAQKNADRWGNFSFYLDSKVIDPTKQITIKLTGVDLISGNTTVPPQNPETDEISFEPIPRYLEGYAYDAQGNLMPFAKVQVVLTMSDKAYYETQANEEAFFSISPRNLPIFPYYLTFTPANTIPGPSTSVKVTIREHSEQNKAYHEQENINIMEGSKAGIPIEPESYVENAGIVKAQEELLSPDQKTQAQKELKEKNRAKAQTKQNITILVLVTVLLIVGIGTILYIRKFMKPASIMNKYQKQEELEKEQQKEEKGA